MKLRKLDVSEHYLTRKLWEEVFTEDTKEFLDYYYFLKTRENEIYVLEDNEIESMVHLNPYKVKIGERDYILHYIVAVATREEHRGKGYMRTLLCKAMEEMFASKEPFTFLMPAAEAIYKPYDFRFMYTQNQAMLTVKKTDIYLDDQEATLGDVHEMAEFYQTYCAPFDYVCINKDETYFQNKLFEQKSEQGGIRIIRQNNKIVCMYAYGREEQLEVLEPYILSGFEPLFEQSVSSLAEQSDKSIPIIGFCKRNESYFDCIHGCKRVPLLMARIIHLQTFLESLQTKKGEHINCSFAVIDVYLQKNSSIWNLHSHSTEDGKIIVSETEDSEGIIPISILTEFLFGQIDIVSMETMDGVILSEHLKQELHKIELLNNVFINEVV